MAKVCHFSGVHIALDNRIFYREALSLHRAGYEVTIIAVNPTNEVKDGVQIIGLPRLARWKRPFAWWRLYKLVVATAAEIYHFHDPELLLIAPLIRLSTGRPVIYDVHELIGDFIEIKQDLPGWLRSPLAWLLRWLEPVLARLVSGLIFADEQIADMFRNINKPKAVLFNYPSTDFLEIAETAIKESDFRNPIVLYLGGLKRDRGSSLMLQAFAQVIDTIPEARLQLVGPFAPDSHEAEVRDLVAHHRLERAVEITGAVPFISVHEYLGQAAVGWIPFSPVLKYQKNIPTKLFEYMAYGLPVVSSDLPSIRPFIRDRQNGLLVDPSDPKAHANAIIELLINPQKAEAMGKLGRELVNSRFRWDEMEKRLLALYAQILQP